MAYVDTITRLMLMDAGLFLDDKRLTDTWYDEISDYIQTHSDGRYNADMLLDLTITCWITIYEHRRVYPRSRIYVTFHKTNSWNTGKMQLLGGDSHHQ